MKAKRLNIPKIKWLITYCVDVESKNIPEVMEEMNKLRMPYGDMLKTRHTIEDEQGSMNWGYTIFSPEQKSMLVLIGPSTDFREFVGTMYHEQNHADSVLSHYTGIKNGSEQMAYIVQAISEHIADIIDNKAMEFHRENNP